jgi:hypothetical protein
VRRATAAYDTGVSGMPMTSMNSDAGPPLAGIVPSRTLTS